MKTAIRLSVESVLLDRATALDIDLSDVLETALSEEVTRIEAERWNTQTERQLPPTRPISNVTVRFQSA